MTIQQALNQIHYLFQRDDSVPESGSDEFVQYTALIDNAINIWENQEGLNWSELYKTATDTIVEGDATYSLATDFRFPAGLLKVGDTEYQYQKPEENHLTSIVADTASRYTITGSLASKVLTIYPTPTEAGSFILPYFKTANTYLSGGVSSVIEMSDPYFVVHFALAQLWIPKNQTTASVHQQIADQKLNAMRIHAEISPIGTLPVHEDLSYSGFGVA